MTRQITFNFLEVTGNHHHQHKASISLYHNAPTKMKQHSSKPKKPQLIVPTHRNCLQEENRRRDRGAIEASFSPLAIGANKSETVVVVFVVYPSLKPFP